MNRYNNQRRYFNSNRSNTRMKTNMKKRPRTGKVIRHPLSHIFTAEHYEYKDTGGSFFFTIVICITDSSITR